MKYLLRLLLNGNVKIRKMMNITKSIVRIGSSDRLGTGFLLKVKKSKYLLTCLHNIPNINDLTDVTFDICSDNYVFDIPIHTNFLAAANDIALFEVKSDILEERFLTLAAEDDSGNNKVLVYGFPKSDTKNGLPYNHALVNSTDSASLSNTARIILTDAAAIKSGFSGSPIFDISKNAVIGIVNKSNDSLVSGIPTSLIIKNFGQYLSFLRIRTFTEVQKKLDGIELLLTKILNFISEEEGKLIRISSLIPEPKRGFTSLEDWFQHILNIEDNEVCDYLDLPMKKNEKEALILLFKSNAKYKTPLLNLFAKRTDVYLATIKELSKNNLSNEELKLKLKNFNSFFQLMQNTKKFAYDNTPSQILKAVKDHSLDYYRDSWHSTNLRVVLSSMYSKNYIEEDVRIELLDFVLKELLKEINGINFYIPEIRHGWWAIQTICKDATEEWLDIQKENIVKCINYFMNRQQSSENPENILPELFNTREYESIWICINMCRILNSKFYTKMPDELKFEIYKQLEEKLDTVRGVAEQDNSMKITHIKLLLYFELFSYYLYRFSEVVLQSESKDLEKYVKAKFKIKTKNNTPLLPIEKLVYFFKDKYKVDYISISLFAWISQNDKKVIQEKLENELLFQKIVDEDKYILNKNLFTYPLYEFRNAEWISL